MPTFLSGGRARGAIRYECNAEPIVMFNCHCRDCQRATGTAFSAVVYEPTKAFKITKARRAIIVLRVKTGGHNLRGFCAECSSRLFGSGSDKGQGINASSLDDLGLFHSQFDIFAADAQSWDQMDPKLPKSDKYPQ